MKAKLIIIQLVYETPRSGSGIICDHVHSAWMNSKKKNGIWHIIQSMMFMPSIFQGFFETAQLKMITWHISKTGKHKYKSD